MVMKCVGYRPPFDYPAKDGTTKQGAEFHGVRSPNSREKDNEGLIAKNIWLGKNDIPLIPRGGFQLGKMYNFRYDNDGKFNFLESIEEVKEDEQSK